MCAVEDCEPWIVVRRSTPTARVEHRCTECRRVIRPGETYERVTGLIDSGGGTWSTDKFCAHCQAMGDFMFAMCGGWPYGQLWDELVDHWREGYASIPLGRLMACMRLKWHNGTDPIPIDTGALAQELMAVSAR
jgi:hypothetical protein